MYINRYPNLTWALGRYKSFVGFESLYFLKKSQSAERKNSRRNKKNFLLYSILLFSHYVYLFIDIAFFWMEMYIEFKG